MTLTFTQVGDLPQYVRGAQRVTVTDVALDSSYPTGGEAVTAANLRLSRLDQVQSQIQTTATTTVNAASSGFDVSTGNVAGVLKVYDETPAEVSNTSDLAGLVVRLTAFGT